MVECGPDFVVAMLTRDNNGLWHFWVYGAGTNEPLSQYVVRLKITSAIDRFVRERKFTYRGPAVSIDMHVDDVIEQHEGLVLTDKSLKCILTEDQEFVVFVEML
jgi:hypothetical protein